jgi:SAM-dependent methyltransferase
MTDGDFQSRWLGFLRCPWCRGGFQFTEAPRPAVGAAEFGVLACGCSRFPVVDGVPIIQRSPVGMFEHTTGRTEVPGIPVAELVRLIEAGESLEALLECLVIPAALPAWSRFLPWRLTHGEAARRLCRRRGKAELRVLLARRQGVSARAIFSYFYRPGRALQPAVGHYFMLRFGQPRHLAALALMANLSANDRPMLDIACGAGHLEHYLNGRQNPVNVIGTDMNFFHVWIARHWLAPESRYVCGNTQDGLPFADDSFSAVLCSDAWHYFHERPTLLREIRRCAPDRPVILTRVGNRGVAPNEGVEETLAGYRAEFGDVALRVYDEEELLQAYLCRQQPLAAPQREDEDLAGSKWLSFIWNLSPPGADGPEGKCPEEAPWDDENWPHAVGEVGLNPIYATSVTANGDLRLTFRFPGTWYAYENHAMLTYHPQQVTIPRGPLMELGRWRTNAHLKALVHSFVLLGLPKRFHA